MPEYTDLIKERFAESLAVKQSVLDDPETISALREIAGELVATYRRGGRVYIAGNGGSAADAQHFAAEMVGRFQKERPGIYAVALTTDTSALTSIANDYGYESVFSRQLEALAGDGDYFIGITTSGNSPNILKAFEYAKSAGIRTAAFTGAGGGRSAEHANGLFAVPSEMTPRVQECHIVAIHILCEIVENSLFDRK